MSSQPLFDLLKVPEPRARRTDPVTSRMAADSVRARKEIDADKALEAHYRHRDTGLDDFQLAEITGIKQTSIGVRRKGLEKLGFVENTGVKRVSPSRLTNSVVILWKITAAGVRYYEEKRERR